MTHEEFQNKVHLISDRKLIEDATIAIEKLCKTGARSFTMTVPPRLDDTDIVLSELTRRFEELILKK